MPAATAKPPHISRFRKSGPGLSIISSGRWITGKVSRSRSTHCLRKSTLRHIITTMSAVPNAVQASVGASHAEQVLARVEGGLAAEKRRGRVQVLDCQPFRQERNEGLCPVVAGGGEVGRKRDDLHQHLDHIHSADAGGDREHHVEQQQLAPAERPSRAAAPQQRVQGDEQQQDEDDVGEERDAGDVRSLPHALHLDDPVAVQRDQQQRQQQHPRGEGRTSLRGVRAAGNGRGRRCGRLYASRRE